MDNKKIKFGVIGVGYLGKYHVKHLAEFDFIDFVGIYDINTTLAESVASNYNLPIANSLDELLNKSDAISIVTPTEHHFEIAKQALQKSCHIFIEKPISNSIKLAEKLLEDTINYKKVSHVGHIERFNPAFKAFMNQNRNPLFIECHRLTKINKRSMDISVVLDLMIHDIDLLIQMINYPIKDIIADGISVLSDNTDLANVKLIFENGAVANLTASRISSKDMRKIRVFENKKYTSVDLLNKEVIEYSTQSVNKQNLTFNHKNITVKNDDALALELRHFCDCIINNDINTQNIRNAIEALRIAKEINKIIYSKRIS
jgi:predicted dehydrogenase